MILQAHNLRHICLKRNFESAKLVAGIMHENAEMKDSVTMSEVLLLINRLDVMISHMPVYKNLINKVFDLIGEIEDVEKRTYSK